MKINVLFGSKSDEKVYGPLCTQLEALGDVEVFMNVCSAHREPERLSKIIKERPCDVYITGAGLAAHLPGVVASQTKTPCIGIPCNDILEGHDALLSTLQMPKGIPVLASSVDGVEQIVSFVRRYLENFDEKPEFIIDAPAWANKYREQVCGPLEKLGWNFSSSSPDALPLVFADLSTDPATKRKAEPFMCVPVVAETPYKGDLKRINILMKQGGLWVGINTALNMQIALLEMWGRSSKECELLAELRTGGVKVVS